jgi:4-amino-4-deoxy-L-arabinose transferase-like glycosyltransferase
LNIDKSITYRTGHRLFQTLGIMDSSMKVAPEAISVRRNRGLFLSLLILTLIGTSIRLIGISQPYVDLWSWRQSDVAMIAENFYLYGYDWLHPRINWAGNVPGYVGTEFPLVPLATSLFYEAFGVQDWVGRSISVFFFSLSVPYLALLIRKHISADSMLFGIAIYLLIPLSILTSRSFIPDTAALCLTTMALYYFSEWLDDTKAIFLMIASVMTATLAVLLKPPSIIAIFAFVFLAYDKWGIAFLGQKRLWVFAIVTMVPPVLWYYHAYQLSTLNPPYHMFGDKSIGFARGIGYWRILQRTMMEGLSLPIAATVLAGVILAIVRRVGLLFLFWLFGIMLFVIFAGRGNAAHAWYRLPLVPVAAAFGGLVVSEIYTQLRKKSQSIAIGVVVMIFIGYGLMSYGALRGYYKPHHDYFKSLGEELNSITAPNDLILVTSGGDPTVLYYAKRKGWHFLPTFGYQPETGKEAIQSMEELRKQGATYLAFTSRNVSWLDYYKDFHEYLTAHYFCVRRTKTFVIYDLRQTSQRDSQFR